MVRNVRPALLLLCFIGFVIPVISLKAQDKNQRSHPQGIEISAGLSYLVYQSGYGFKSFQGIEILLSKQLGECLKTETGIRTSISPLLPEVFVRGVISNQYKSWRPVFGVETGITNRADFNSSSELLKETRGAMAEDIGSFYVSAHIEWLSFNLKPTLNFSFLEFDVGTHYKHFGRTLRAQTTLFRIRKTI